jgi:hypothetical protein
MLKRIVPSTREMLLTMKAKDIRVTNLRVLPNRECMSSARSAIVRMNAYIMTYQVQTSFDSCMDQFGNTYTRAILL